MNIVHSSPALSHKHHEYHYINFFEEWTSDILSQRLLYITVITWWQASSSVSALTYQLHTSNHLFASYRLWLMNLIHLRWHFFLTMVNSYHCSIVTLSLFWNLSSFTNCWVACRIEGWYIHFYSIHILLLLY